MLTNDVILQLVYIILSIHLTISQYIDNQLCSSKCLCLPDDNLISCDKSSNIAGLPTNIDSSFHRLMIQFGRFKDPIIYRRNLTGLGHLSLLRVVYCKLGGIESRAFEDMNKLRYLDLSHNDIRVIQPFTFIGLNLAELHLMENRGIILFADSFKGMNAESINLRSNFIESIDLETFKGINFQNLYLYDNKISFLDPRFSTLFRDPEILIDLTGNPLDCNCEMKWLLEFLKSKFRDQKYYNQMKTVNMTCSKPLLLAGREIIKLSEKDFQCDTPKILSISIIFGIPSTQLTCVAIGSTFRSPGVAWNYIEEDNVKELRRNPLTNFLKHNGKLHTTLSINVSTDRQSSNAFTCTSWLEDSYSEKIVVHIKLPLQMYKNIPPIFRKDIDINNTMENENMPFLDFTLFYQKHFTILELLGAIVGSFVITLIILMMLIQILRWWKMSQIRQVDYKNENIINPYWTMGNDSNNTYSHSANPTEYDVLKVYESQPTSLRQIPPVNAIEFRNYKTLNNI